MIQPHSTRPLFEHLEEIKQAVTRARRILLLLDFDGTLAPIAETPDLAILPQETRSLLALLSKKSRVRLAIISGRGITDLKERVGLELIYAGNHGLEIEGLGLEFHFPGLLVAQSALTDLASVLANRLKSIDGVLIENKGLTLSVHYRKVGHSQVPFVLSAIESACTPYELRHGKKVFEVRPRVRWDKGKAAQWILQQLGGDAVLPICIGDDKTDEDIFRSLPLSISIKVGDEASAARYRVSDPGEVRVVLREIYDLLEKRDMH